MKMQLKSALLSVLIAAFAHAQNPATSPASAPAIAPPGHLRVAWHGHFSELPVGTVTPRGWIQRWLQRQADGMTGHPENLAYPYDTCMYAGKIPPPVVKHGEVWWGYEQSGYFIDGAVRLSHLLDDPAAKRIPDSSLLYIVDHSGPAKLGESTWGWPNAVVGRALMAEYSATGNPKISQVLNDSVSGTTATRSRDGFVFEQALYLYGLTGDSHLLAYAKKVYEQDFFNDPKSFSNIDKIRGEKPLREHGVTAAEQLKLLPLMYSCTGDAQALELANLAYRKVENDSRMPDGGMVSSESLGTAAFNSMHETCDIIDWSWSVGYLLMAGGEGHWADLIEQTTFNALPGAVTKDFKQVQYFSSANQILASSTACPRIAPTRMSYRAAHETECCGGNVNRAMPNYVTRMWMGTGDGVAATLYGPSEVKLSVHGQPVAVAEDTDYPFRDSIKFKVNVAQPTTFSLGLRIPEWCQSPAVTVNGGVVEIAGKAGSFATLNREFRDGDTIELHLPMTVQLRDWFDGKAVSVQRGPLVYSLKIDEKRVESLQDPAPIRRVLKGNNIQGFPAVEFFPQGQWRYGMDAAVKQSARTFRVVESPMLENPFVSDAIPVRIEIPLRPLPQWQADWKPVADPPSADIRSAPKNPASLPGDAELKSPGELKTMTMVPYGSTYLRLTTLPVIQSPEP